MDEQIKFQFPIITVKEVRPLLCKGKRVLAYQIEGSTESGHTLMIYENKGLDLKEFIGKKVECLFEITRGAFEYKDDKGKKPEGTFVFQYQWQKRLYEFFPELSKIRDSSVNANSKEEQLIEEKFETTATKFFNEWGLNGLALSIYQDKPMLKSPDGFFLLNEYEFEDEIDMLELNEEVYIEIDEVFLRGIRPCKVSERAEQKHGFILLEQIEESKETKKRGLFFG